MVCTSFTGVVEEVEVKWRLPPDRAEPNKVGASSEVENEPVVALVKAPPESEAVPSVIVEP
jgi:hypothetical protein